MGQVNNEKFKLWKLALASIHLDGKVTSEEEEWFKQSIAKLEKNQILNFTVDQIKQLQASLHTPADQFVAEFKEIKKPSDRSILLHIIKIVCHTDSEFAPAEQTIYDKLVEACHANVDIESVKKKTLDMEIKSYHEDEVYKVNNPDSIFEQAFMNILKILNPGDYKFPS
jgi:hypothetical protein